MSTEVKQNSGGIGFFGLLQIVFITLKLLSIIKWPWVLVLLPTLIPVGILLGFLLFILVIVFLKAVI